MWEPVGPLPASVYWKRRALAIASTVAALLLLAWSIASIIDPSPAGDGATARAAGRAALSAPQQSSAHPGATGTAIVLPGASDPSGAGASEVATSGTGPAEATTPDGTPSGAPATTSEELRPDDTPRPSVPVPPPVPVPPTGPVPCTNGMLAVGAEVDRPEHRIGQRPTFRLVITNISGQPCVRDLDSARQEIVVWSGNGADRLWSSNDCANASSIDLRTLVPGQPIAFAVTWAGRTSTPGCADARTEVPAGAYRVMTRLDDIISTPTPFLRSA